MRVEAAVAIMRALRVRTVAGGELHDSLLMRTVCRTSGVYSECLRLSLCLYSSTLSRDTTRFCGSGQSGTVPAHPPYSVRAETHRSVDPQWFLQWGLVPASRGPAWPDLAWKESRAVEVSGCGVLVSAHVAEVRSDNLADANGQSQPFSSSGCPRGRHRHLGSVCLGFQSPV